METFADYILSEKDWIKKMEIMHYLQLKTGIFFIRISARRLPKTNPLIKETNTISNVTGNFIIISGNTSKNLSHENINHHAPFPSPSKRMALHFKKYIL